MKGDNKMKCEFDFCENDAETKVLVFCCRKHLRMLLKTKVRTEKEMEEMEKRLFDDGR